MKASSDKKSPPKLAQWILEWSLHSVYIDDVLGDLEEAFRDRCEYVGRGHAARWYWGQCLRSLPMFFQNAVYWGTVMLKNYLKIALRNLRKEHTYSVINIVGLALGLACSILIMLWVLDEISTDQFHEKIDDIYIVGTDVRYGDRMYKGAGTPPGLGPAFELEYPEIIRAGRLQNGTASLLLSYGDKRFTHPLQMADQQILEIFSFPFIYGDLATALLDPHSLVLTEDVAERFFGGENPIGKTVTVENEYEFTVTGVLENLPHNSSIRFSALVPLVFLDELGGRGGYLDTWYNLSFRTYVEFQPGTPIEPFNAKIEGRINQANPNDDVVPFLRRFGDLYLYWMGQGDGRIILVTVFSMIALFILLIACFNFMNLTTARSGNRAKEVGMRKVAGAYRRDIMKQFYGESLLLSFISLGVAIGLAALFLPTFNLLAGKPLRLDFINNPELILALIGVALVTGIVAGSYPALFMSSFKAVNMIKSASGFGIKGSGFRKTLVVVQFVLTVFLIIWTSVLFRQLDFIRDADLGFEKEHLIYVPLHGNLTTQYEAARQELLKDPSIQYASVTSHVPTGIYWNGSNWDWEGKSPDINPLVTYFSVGFDFLETFDIELDQGMFYSADRTAGPTDSTGQVVINEAFARIMGLEEPVGAYLLQGDDRLTVMGVISDFHFKPLHQRIEPLMVMYRPDRFRYMFAKISPNAVSEAIAHIEEVHSTFSPEFPFTYHFLDEDFERLYQSQQHFGLILRSFAILAIIISCLGLFGLASFMAERRTQEIGIRKVLGANILGILILLTREFVKWVAIANIIAWPVAWIFSTGWLQNFAYRIDPAWDIYIYTALATLGIALLTVCYQAFRAARANPVESLRYE